MPGTWSTLVWTPVVLAAAVAADARGEPLGVRVEPVGGVPTFVLSRGGEGTPRAFLDPCFETYTPNVRHFRQFAEAGVRLFSFNTNAAACDYGHSRPTWTGPDAWDYSGFDERMAMVLEAAPDAMVMPRVNMGTPLWWLAAHPGECEVLDHGSTLYREPNRNPTLPKGRPFPSPASEEWRRDMGQALRRLVRHIRESGQEDRVFGYFLAGLDTEEWYHWSSGSDQLAGYSTPTRTAFQAWLRRRYGDPESLCRAWNRERLTFEDVTVPSRAERLGDPRAAFRDPSRQMNVIDFYLFYNELVVETIDYFAQILKQESGGGKVVGAFYGYMYEFAGDPEYGHNALARYCESDALDFVFVTASYGNRHFATGGDYARSPAGSVLLNGKLWYHDNDVVSFLAAEKWKDQPEDLGNLNDVRTWRETLGFTESPLHTIWMYRRSFGFALCSGAYESFFDLHGGYYDHPLLMQEVKRITAAARTAAGEDRGSAAEILIVADEVSCAYAGFRSRLLDLTLRQTQWNLIRIGAPADHVLLEHLPRVDPSRYRLIVFLNAYHMTSGQREWIDRHLKNEGRVLLFCCAAGHFDRERVYDNLRPVVGMDVVRDRSRERVSTAAVPVSGDHPLHRALASLDLQRVGPDGDLAPLFRVTDPLAVPIGVDPAGGGVTFALKHLGTWTSVYAPSSLLPPEVYRALAVEAGVHVFNDRSDALYANRSFVCVHADGAGRRTVRFPSRGRLTDLMTGTVLAAESDELVYDFQNGETLIIQYRDAP